MNKIHTRKTLFGYNKNELVEHCMCLEHNLKAMKQSFEVQYKNCLMIVNDMNLLNDEFKKSKNLTRGLNQPSS